jgi:hypothetical protein
MDLYRAIKIAQAERDKAYRQRDNALSRIAELTDERDSLRAALFVARKGKI